MRTSVRFTHDSNNSDTTCCSDWLSLQERSKLILIFLWQSTDDIDQFRSLWYFILPSDLVDQIVQHNLFSLLINIYQPSDDLCDIFMMKYVNIHLLFVLLVRLWGCSFSLNFHNFFYNTIINLIK